jgi:hypothetical protein
MLHRLLALLGFVAIRIDGWLRAPLARLGIRISGIWLIALVLLVAAAIPTYLEATRRSPQGVDIDQITQRSLSALTSWVRLEGRVVTLDDNRQAQAQYGVTSVLIDGDKAIMLSSSQPVEDREEITGQAANAPGAGDRVRSLAPPGLLDGIQVSPNGLVLVDDVPPPPSTTPWWAVYTALIVAGLLVIGLLVGYPVFGASRRSSRAPVLDSGERVPVGVSAELRRSGRTTSLPIGGAQLDRGERPGELVVHIPEAVDAPAHEVPIRPDMWTSVSTGSLYTVSAAVPAFQVRSFALHGIVSFSSALDRDRAAAVLTEAGSASSSAVRGNALPGGTPSGPGGESDPHAAYRPPGEH